MLEELKQKVYDANMLLPKYDLVKFTWGATVDEAIHSSVVLEEIAFMNFHSLMLDPSLGNMQKALLEKHFYRKHGKDAYYGQK